jgi:ABC-2 type transport system ATP-binding protein
MEIVINKVIKTYRNRNVVDIESLKINQGELFGIVGDNGAGKTTLFRLILDLVKPDHGEIKSGGIHVAKSEAWKYYTSAFLDSFFLIDFLTPEEYFSFIGKLYGLKSDEINTRLETYLLFMNNEILNQNKYIRQFSTGNKQKIGIIGALLVEPGILILDEPFNYLDPASQNIIKMIIKDFNKNHNSTVLISSHNLNHMTETCTRIILMGKGKIINDITENKNGFKEIERYFSRS